MTPITHVRLERLARRGDDEVRSAALELIEVRAEFARLRETRLVVARVRAEIAPEHWPGALRDVKRGGDGEPDLDEAMQAAHELTGGGG